MNKQQNVKGFTIIEVVLVLAIAALIFLMVFLALPALQRGTRDTQRKNDLSRFQTAIQNYASNSRGDLPSAATLNSTFVGNYLTVNGDTFADPSTGNTYTITTTGTPDAVGKIVFTTNSKCKGDGSELEGAQGARKFAVQTKLEGSGVACQNN